jgi:hypothetical protein
MLFASILSGAAPASRIPAPVSGPGGRRGQIFIRLKILNESQKAAF